ncbi:hypothetical protein CEXT_408571 [Caerostris extrusa]|uniref:Ycf15 n=1 Tax=Caerostris extrusa TaxID=172846 RepID=A0AAV4MLG4_CAEEX|nr:hypothetical protein CEXT_408571 [Caerostris extrusa]
MKAFESTKKAKRHSPLKRKERKDKAGHFSERNGSFRINSCFEFSFWADAELGKFFFGSCRNEISAIFGFPRGPDLILSPFFTPFLTKQGEIIRKMDSLLR